MVFGSFDFVWIIRIKGMVDEVCAFKRHSFNVIGNLGKVDERQQHARAQSNNTHCFQLAVQNFFIF